MKIEIPSTWRENHSTLWAFP